jgi:hypothetical protein
MWWLKSWWPKMWWLKANNWKMWWPKIGNQKLAIKMWQPKPMVTKIYDDQTYVAIKNLATKSHFNHHRVYDNSNSSNFDHS